MQVLSPDFSRYLSHSITILPDARGHNDAHGACTAGLPGICDVNLVSHTMGDDKSPSARSRGICKPEKPTKVHLPAHSAPRLRRNPPTARKTHRFLNGGRVTYSVKAGAAIGFLIAASVFSHRLPSLRTHAPCHRLNIFGVLVRWCKTEIEISFFTFFCKPSY